MPSLKSVRESLLSSPISRNAIKPQLEKALAERGWRIQVVEKADDNLWWNELWTLASVWAPAGFRVYITFEFDDVWEWLGAATERPINHHDTTWFARLCLDKTWKAEFPRFIADLNRIRDESEAEM